MVASEEAGSHDRPASQAPERLANPVLFSLIAVIVGVITGFGAVFFRALIAFVHNLFFLGRFSTVYDANVHTPASPWGAFDHSGAGDRRHGRGLSGQRHSRPKRAAMACPK